MDPKVEQLGKGKIPKLLLNYALPAIIATTASSLYNIIDRIFIGHGVGAMAISGLALTFPIMNLAIAFGTLVGAGASAMVSIRMGQKRRADATRILGNALVLNLIIGISFTILSLIFLEDILRLFGASDNTLPYAHDFMQVILSAVVVSHLFFGLNNVMRSSGYPKKAMTSILLTIGVNIILAPLFIFVFNWGIRGAAFATVLSQSVGLVWVLIHFMSRKPYIHFRPSGFRLKKRIIADIFAIGLSPFIIHVASSAVSLITNLQLTGYGGDYAIGSYGIIGSIAMLVVMIVFGFTQGMQPIVGFNYGAKQFDRVTEVLKLTIFWATAISFLGFLAGMLFPEQIARAFTDDEIMIATTVHGMRITLIVFFVIGFQVVVSSFFQYIGKAKIAIFLSLSRQVIFLIPFLLLLPRFYELDGVWAALPASDLLASVITAFILFYYRNKLRKDRENIAAG
ncbi:Multidrug export protein MepA [bioreactor metagenome]|uniref:Multidrug export protein MepA n=1 Tax=bioreactor metagenome TaxID=1076179 RepID=A0A644WFC9_9ZZZZ